MRHYQSLVAILNSIDHMYGSKDCNYTVIENDEEEITGVNHYGAEIDPLDEICEANSEINEFINRLNGYKLSLAQIERQIELDREFPESED